MTPLGSLAHDPITHFQLQFYAAALRLREHAPEERHPFLRGYCADPDAAGLAAPAAWDAAVEDWESGAPPLPLVRLASAASLDRAAIHALFLVGLVDEDARFGAIFEPLTGHPRPTAGLLHSWWAPMRPGLRRLAELGLVEASDAHTPRADSPLRVPPIAWDAIRGDPPDRLESWARHREAATLPTLDELILAEPLRSVVRRAPVVLAAGTARAIVVRGPASGGRRTILGAIARAAGLGLLDISAPADGDARWRIVGSLATLLHAMPAVVLDVAAGETVHIAEPAGWLGPLGVVLGQTGGVDGPPLERAVTLTLGIAELDARARHWAAALGPEHGAGPELAARFRMTGGNIRRTAALARAEAALAGRAQPSPVDVTRGARALQSRLLDTLAKRVGTVSGWERVAVRRETMRELQLLEVRCRHRERIRSVAGPAADLTAGVRALLTGPSGTGKTLAARTLAGVLGIDLYRVDLSTVVNKYLGETEKNLDRLLSRAEEADAALLLDEGDALMTRRTDVQSSNDRYANLETNFLLQRLESFDGIVLITTNAADRIDDAFRRRMDVVIDFGLPDERERWSIWRLHLPERHDVDDELVEELAVRCALSGGQMRNAVLHASLLALEAGGRIGAAELEAAVRREYHQAGHVCPLAAEAPIA
ncbi:MAG TPA: ATP-binding protein [Solirubrobacteraceae bacterium]|jgi:hypothetical protein|nr:ATP-binding protein [Solirubrobacteraceae bacterium]